MLHNYSKNNIFNELLEYIDNKNLEVFLVHNFTPHITNRLNSITGKVIVLFYIGDYFLYDLLDEILCNSRIYKEQHGKLKNYYVILSVHDIEESIKKEYVDEFTFICNPLFYVYYNSIFPQPTNNIHATKKLHFLSFNGSVSGNKQSLFYFMEKFSLREKSYFSYAANVSRSTFSSLEEVTDSLIKDNLPWYLKNLNLHKLNAYLPITIPNHNHNSDYTPGEDFLFEDTFCSIIIETYSAQQFPFLTEKTFRSIVQQHPFILHASAGSLAKLRSMGFRTFGEFWDESYDQLSDNQRLEAIMHLMLEVGQWGIEKINEVHKKMVPVLEHNKNHFFNMMPNMYQDYTAILFNQIKKIVHEKQLAI